jgi:hypothetical protein
VIRLPAPLVHALAIVALFVALGVLYTYPLIHYLPRGLPYTHAPPSGGEVVERAQGDYLQFYFHLWLLRDTVRGRTPFLSNPYEFVGQGPPLRVWTYYVPVSLVYLVLTPLGDFVAYNGLVLLSYGLAALAMFYLARNLVGQAAPALVAAAVFALAPYRHAVLIGGHPAGSAFFLLPIVLLGVERGLRTGRRAWAFVAGGAVLGLAFVEPHFLYFTVLTLPLLILIRILPGGLQTPDSPGLAGHLRTARRALWGLWPLALLTLAALGVMLNLKVSLLDVSVARAGRSLREIELFSPEPAEWLVRFNPLGVRSIYPGIVPVALAALGIAGRAWRPEPAPRRWLLMLAGLFVLAEVLSVGRKATVPVYEWLAHVVPYLGFVRQTSKFQALALLALAPLAAAGARQLTAMTASTRWLGAGVVGLLVVATVLDYWPARPVGISLLPTENRVYRALREAGDGSVLYVPVWPGDSSWSSLYQFATTLTRRPMVNGYSPAASRRYVEDVYAPLEHVNRGELTHAEHAQLRGLGVRFLVLDRGAFPSKVSPFPSGFTLARFRSSPHLELVTQEGPLWLFALRATPGPAPAVLPSSAQGLFFEAERLPRNAGRAVDSPDASWHRAVRTREDSAGRGGFLVWGAKAGLPRGTFRIFFEIRGRGPLDAPMARIEAVTGAGSRTLASRWLAGRDLAERYEGQALALALDRPEWVEFRLFWTGQGELELDYIYGLFADQADPPRVLQPEDLALDRGPYRRFPAGAYRLDVQLGVTRPTRDPVAHLQVVTAHERAPLASRLVRGAEMGDPGTALDLALPLHLGTPRVIELLVDLLTPGATVGQVRVTPLPR